ncbi:MAG: hypothetical protein QOF48_1367 [Verrucomicrobiota bacterium]|jgi:hypothetical protein
MLPETLSKIEQRVRNADSITPQQRTELLALLATLKVEVSQLSDTHHDEAQSIAGFTAVSAHEATRDARNPELMQLSLQGLSHSAGGFEKSHPRLVEVVNSIATMLANLGI